LLGIATRRSFALTSKYGLLVSIVASSLLDVKTQHSIALTSKCELVSRLKTS